MVKDRKIHVINIKQVTPKTRNTLSLHVVRVMQVIQLMLVIHAMQVLCKYTSEAINANNTSNASNAGSKCSADIHKKISESVFKIGSLCLQLYCTPDLKPRSSNTNVPDL